jgi:hypothetical protein
MHLRLRASPLALALLAMEAALELPLLYAWPFGGRVGLALVATLAALAGYLATTTGLVQRTRTGHLLAGGLLGLALRVAQAGLPAELDTGAILGWLFAALPAMALCATLWWRGQALAEDLPSARWVLNAFTLVGTGLLFSVGFYGPNLGVEGGATIGLVVLFLLSGLVAVALGRQEEAGGGSLGVVAVTVLAVVLLGALPFVLLSPQLLALAQAAAWLLGQLIILLLTPLIWLLERLSIGLEDVAPQRPPTETRPGDQPAWVPPDWLMAVAAFAATVLVVLLVTAALALVLWIVWEVFQRYALWSRAGKRPARVEREDLDLDGRSALLRLRGWLLDAAHRVGERLPNLAGEQDARTAEAAYRSMLRWARRHGVVRAPSETPRELLVRLQPRVPAASDDLGLLTGHYLRARYGRHPAPPEALATLATALRRLQHAPWEQPEPAPPASP